MPHPCLCRNVLLFCLLISGSRCCADDWPMWRYDAGRTAQSMETLPADLQLLWTRKLPPLKPAYRNARLQFDAGYEPVVAGKTLFVGSSRNDRLTAYNTETGAERWRFYTDGPIRLAPVVWQDKVYFGSDDGYLYCLDTAQGKLIWKFRAVPSTRKVIGNGRLISLWPLRGGPVISQGTIYFAAGVWPFEGIFIYAIDAATGKQIWLNDHTGYIYGQHPHNTEAFGGITPQGYLVVSGNDLIVPCGAAFPATLDLKTGKLKQFALPKEGRLPGGWFSAEGKARRRGKEAPEPAKIVFDKDINTARHEDDQRQGPGEKGVRTSIVVNDREFKFEEKIEGVAGTIHSMIAADGKLFVVTKQGTISCLGQRNGKVINHELPAVNIKKKDDSEKATSELVRNTKVQNGYGLILGIEDITTIDQLLNQTNMNLIAVDKDARKVAILRRQLDERGLYGTRISLKVADPLIYEFPPYLASLVVCDKGIVPEGDAGKQFLERIYQSLRPYGGKIYFPVSNPDIAAAEMSQLIHFRPVGGDWRFNKKYAMLTRSGKLPGATNYTGTWSSPDQLVRAPLGVLWFGDEVSQFKRAPQPFFVDGVMISYDKAWRGYPSGERPPYKLVPPIYSDIYTGRQFSKEEMAAKIATLPKLDITQKQLYNYRPPYQKENFPPEKADVGMRINPLTGKKEPRNIVKNYGCDGGVDYGLMFTVRSGNAAFYDKKIESGTIHISGPRSGCTNSIIPAGGLLNVPYYYQGCTCSYPLPVGLSMFSLPETHEQWMVWGKGNPKEIQRIGINFGAPGDRVTHGGTLWLEYPLNGGPSPTLDIEVLPKDCKTYYHHSLWITGGNGWPWVVASGIEGASSIRLKNLKPGSYTVRLYFAEPKNIQAGERLFDVTLQGKKVLADFDVTKQSGGKMRAIVKEFSGISSNGELNISLHAIKGKAIISGFELIAEGLPGEPVTTLKSRVIN